MEWRLMRQPACFGRCPGSSICGFSADDHGPVFGGCRGCPVCFGLYATAGELTLRLSNVAMDELSMGMSGDYQVAVEEGSTIVRGTAIFAACSLSRQAHRLESELMDPSHWRESAHKTIESSSPVSMGFLEPKEQETVVEPCPATRTLS